MGKGSNIERLEGRVKALRKEVDYLQEIVEDIKKGLREGRMKK
jgi:archaellum component FlaC